MVGSQENGDLFGLADGRIFQDQGNDHSHERRLDLIVRLRVIQDRLQEVGMSADHFVDLPDLLVPGRVDLVKYRSLDIQALGAGRSRNLLLQTVLEHCLHVLGPELVPITNGIKNKKFNSQKHVSAKK